MRLLIIGSRGFIGGHCMTFFAGKGWSVRGADIRCGPGNDYTRLAAANPDFGSLLGALPVDACINASGSAHVGYSFDHPERDYELNTLNVHRLLVAIRENNPVCRLVNFSSAAVYGDPGTLPIREDAATHPLSPYGFHKLQSEHLLREYSGFFGLRTCSLRVFSAYGPGLRKQLFWDLYQKAMTGRRVELFGSGDESRDFIFIQDLCHAIEVVLRSAEFRGEAVNVASGVEIPVRMAAREFLDEYDDSLELRFSNEPRQGDPRNWRADISRLRNMGFTPSYDLRAGIGEYVEWLRGSA